MPRSAPVVAVVVRLGFYGRFCAAFTICSGVPPDASTSARTAISASTSSFAGRPFSLGASSWTVTSHTNDSRESGHSQDHPEPVQRPPVGDCVEGTQVELGSSSPTPGVVQPLLLRVERTGSPGDNRRQPGRLHRFCPAFSRSRSGKRAKIARNPCQAFQRSSP